ncbi:hypothetical protein BDL97_19G044600 [Sphagnum fallax]|nr:hypothetical protein BDL97_19G044600 [Sphagnum fallax]
MQSSSNLLRQSAISFAFSSCDLLQLSWHQICEQLYGAACSVETLLTTNFNTPSFWMSGRKLFEAAVVVVKDADEAERMHACLEQATAASQAEDTFAVGSEILSQNELTENGESSPSPVIEHETASDDWNSTVASGQTSGWISVDGPTETSNGNSAVDGSATEPGLLGSGPQQPEGKPVELPPRELHTYYMVRVPRPVDQTGKNEIILADLRLKEKTEERDYYNAAVQMQRSKRNEALDRLKAARQQERDCRNAVRAKLQEMTPLKGDLRKLKEAGRAPRESRDLPTSEEELDRRIAYLNHTIQHESITLKEEKQLVRDIKQLQSSRDQVRASEALRAQVHESLGQREDIEEHLKLLSSDHRQLDGELHEAVTKRKSIEEEFEKLDKALGDIQGQLAMANQVRQEAYEARQNLVRTESARSDEFYRNRREIQTAKQLAIQNNRKAVEELCNAQVERILSLWNGDKEFRENYVKSNERSTLKRLGTLDGRSLGPDEEPPLLSSYTDRIPNSVPQSNAKVQTAVSGFEAASSGDNGTAANGAEVKEAVGKKSKPTGTEISEPEKSVKRDVEDVHVEPTATVKEVSNTAVEVDPVASEEAEFKHKQRASEMAKAKEAEERKRRMAERSQSKALAWAQKEAERKEREKEKKARKKAASARSTETPNPSDTTPLPASNGIVSEIEEEQAPVETVPSSQQKKRPITQKKPVKAAVTNRVPVSLPVRGRASASKKELLFGLPLQVWLIITAIVVLLLLLLVFVSFRGNLEGETGKVYEKAASWKQRFDFSHSQSHLEL